MPRSVALVAAVLLASPAAADLRREAEPNDAAAAAQPVIPPASLGGVISVPGDADLYAVAVEAGGTVEADVLARGFRAGSQPGSELSALLEVLDTDGVTVLAQDQSLGDFDDPTVRFTVTASGRYFLSVRDVSPSEGGSDYRYVLSVEVDPNDALADAIPLRPPVLPSIDALIHPAGDHDTYRVDGLSGQVLTVDIDSAVFNPTNPPTKAVLTLFDAAQNLLAQDAYTSSDPEDPFLQITLPSDGTYFIQVRELRSFVGTTNTFYQLSVDVGPAAENDGFASSRPVDLPRALSGTVSPAGDIDHFRFTLAGPATLQADLDAGEDLLSLLVGTLALHDSLGTIASDASGPDPLLAQALTAGEYSVSVEGPCGGGGCENEDSYYVLFLDGDDDGDGLVLPADNCPTVDNLDQADADGDGAGDPCDNCPTLFNPGQVDDDSNGVGDACEACLPGEVAPDLAFVGPQDMVWTTSGFATAYNVYRGTIVGGAWAYDHACLISALPGPTATVAEDPLAGAFYYLLSGTSLCGEGPLGLTAAGALRPNDFPCP